MMNILILNGPNINLLGQREPNIYGTITYDELCSTIKEYCKEKNVSVEIFQSNHEGELIDYIQNSSKYDAIIFNAGGYTHTSVAIRDAIASVKTKVIEVHLTNILHRELFRRRDLIKKVCIKRIMGKGINSYIEAINYAINNLCQN